MFYGFKHLCNVCHGTGKTLSRTAAAIFSRVLCPVCRGTGYREWGSFETFQATAKAFTAQADGAVAIDCREPGWYWHERYPGHDPIGETVGPFTTEDEAIGNAQASKD